MKGDPKVIEFLNQGLRNELTSINQYFLHSKMLKNWGVKKLADITFKESIEEMHHADRLIERILFLEGLPNLQDLGRLRVGENTQEILKCDLALENAAIPMFREAIVYCEQVRDFVSRDLFASILAEEEEHVDFLETQLGLTETIGLQNYIQSMSSAGD